MAKSILARLAAMGGGTKKGTRGPEKAATDRWPCLIELLTTSTLPDGSEREVSKLTICWQDGSWKAGITEPGMEASAWASSGVLEGLLDALEQRLASDDPDTWRKWSGAFKGKQKGNKKA